MSKNYEKISGGQPGANSSGDGPGVGLWDLLSEGMVIRRDQQILYANAAARRMFGFEMGTSALDLHTVAECIHPEDRNLVGESYAQRISGEDAPDEYEFRIVREDKSLCWVRCRAFIVDWQGEPASAGCLTDITEQKEAEKAQGRTEKLFTNIFRLTPEAMLISSLTDGRILDVNPAFLNIFGRRRDDVLGSTSSDLKIWADPTFEARFIEELKTTSSMTDVPATVMTRGNLIRHFRLFAQKIEHENEPVLLLIGRDVTEEMAHAEDMKTGKEVADLANRAKSEFLANMSHELRTPLNAILGFSEIVRDEMIGPIGVPRYAEYASDIHDSGTHLLEIINDILDLSKVEAGRLEAHLTWIEPVECLEACLTLVQQRAFDGNISIRNELDRAVLLEADERLVKQIALNLLTNAVKFTEPGGTVTLALERIPGAGLCLSVADTGIGMTSDEIKVARRPFGQVESTFSAGNEGSGLGLPLVAAFTEKLNATLKIDSQPGVGTRVTVTFPGFKVRDRDPETG